MDERHGAPGTRVPWCERIRHSGIISEQRWCLTHEHKVFIVGSIIYDFLTESFLFDSEAIDHAFADVSDHALLNELQRYRDFCLQNLRELESEAVASPSILRVFSGRRPVSVRSLKQSALYIEQCTSRPSVSLY
jgi:hypothetical protein